MTPATGAGPGRRLAMFPLGTVLFPGGRLPLHVFEPRYRQMIADCLGGDRRFGVVLISRGSEVGGGDQRVSVGTEAHIEQASEFPDGRWAVLAAGTGRIAVESWLPEDPYPAAVVQILGEAADPPDDRALREAAAAVRRAWALLSELGRVPAGSDPLADAPAGATRRAWALCDAAPLGPLDRQRLLETDDPAARLGVLTELTLGVAEDLHRLLAQGGP